MVADVSYWVRIMKQQQPKSSPLITRDLLPDLHSSKELDLDLHVPHGFHKRLDLKSGKVYLERCKPSEQSTTTTTNQRLQDLNFPPPSRKPLNLFDDTNLDLKLHPHSYQSVCTLDKVKFALQRAQKEPIKKRSSMSPSSNSSSISVVKEKETDNNNDNDDDDDDKSYAAGCPSCLLYVLISTSNPRCPRCNITVPSPSPSPIKKPRIDLNLPI